MQLEWGSGLSSWKTVPCGNCGGTYSSNISRYQSTVTVSSKTKGAVTLQWMKMCHTFTFALSLFSSHVTCEFLFPLILQLCSFTAALTWKIALSEKHILWRKLWHHFCPVFLWQSLHILLVHVISVLQAVECCKLLDGGVYAEHWTCSWELAAQIYS